MTLTQRTELERKAKAATPGPWWIERHDGKPYEILGMFNGTLPDKVIECRWACATERGERDYAYIAACSPETILSLLSALTEAEGRVEAARNAARTKGTIEVCKMLDCPCKFEYQWADCTAANCPVRAFKTTPREAQPSGEQ